MSMLEYSEVYSPKYHEFVEITKKHERSHWTEDEVKLQQDVEQWKTGKITEEEKRLITNILRFFTQADLNVGTNYYEKLIPVFKNAEVRDMFGSFAAREGVHKRGYALLSDTLGVSSDFYHEFLEYQEMKDKHEFQMQEIGSSFSDRAKFLAKMVLMEGVSLFAMFAILLNFDRLGKLPGMADLNKWSLADEDQHAEGNALAFNTFCSEHPRIVDDVFKKDIYECARQIIKLEDKFIDKCFSLGGVSNLTAEDVKKYIRYVADSRLKQLGLKANWHVKENPLPWMDWMLARTFGNFFERAIFEYSKANLKGDMWEGISFTSYQKEEQ